MKEIPDPRCNRKKTHDCAEVLTYLILGYICGRTALRRALAWAWANEELLRKHMKLSGGIASVSTVSRLLGSIDEELFALTFADWVSQFLNRRGLHIIIDGKALRGATKKIENGNTPYTLNAIDAATEMVMAQMAVDLKTNEITAIPKLIETIDVEDNLVTIDAIGTQIPIMEQLNELGAGFMLQVKGNQPQIYKDICAYFDYVADEKRKTEEDKTYHTTLDFHEDQTDCYESDEKNRERYEYRKVTTSVNTACISKMEEMSYIKTIGVVYQVRRLIIKDTDGNDVTPSLKTFLAEGSARQPKPQTGDGMADAVQRTGILSNREMTAQEAGKIKREHWRIENGLHHVLDDAFREDRSPAKGSRNNLALIRKIAYNIIRYALHDLARKCSVIAMMDYFADNPKEMVKYVFNPLKRIEETN